MGIVRFLFIIIDYSKTIISRFKFIALSLSLWFDSKYSAISKKEEEGRSTKQLLDKGIANKCRI